MTPAVAELHVGSTVWIFDYNHRVYAKDASGRSIGGPIWREHWVPYKITGETRVSWITDRGKFPKKPNKRGLFMMSQGMYSALEVAPYPEYIDNEEWRNTHARIIAERVRAADVATLRRIAEIIGYEVKQ